MPGAWLLRCNYDADTKQTSQYNKERSYYEKQTTENRSGDHRPDTFTWGDQVRPERFDRHARVHL